MKQAYYAFGGAEQTYAERMESAARWGLDGVEFLNNLDLREPSASKARELRGRMDALGLSSPCFSMWVEMMQEPAPSLARVERYMEMAAVLGCRYFHHTFGPARAGQSDAAYLHEALCFADKTAEMAAQRGMLLLTEPQGLSMNGTDMLGAYFAEMGERAGLVLDTGNILESGEDNAALLSRLGHLVKHVHIKDMVTRPVPGKAPDGWRPCKNGRMARQSVVGEGELPLLQIMQTLALLHYDGWFALECRMQPQDFPRDFEQSLRAFSTLYRTAFCD